MVTTAVVISVQVGVEPEEAEAMGIVVVALAVMAVQEGFFPTLLISVNLVILVEVDQGVMEMKEIPQVALVELVVVAIIVLINHPEEQARTILVGAEPLQDRGGPPDTTEALGVVVL